MEGQVDGSFYWTDGSLSEWRNWASGRPNDTEPFNCVRIRESEGYLMDDDNCEIHLPYICEYGKLYKPLTSVNMVSYTFSVPHISKYGKL